VNRSGSVGQIWPVTGLVYAKGGFENLNLTGLSTYGSIQILVWPVYRYLQLQSFRRKTVKILQRFDGCRNLNIRVVASGVPRRDAAAWGDKTHACFDETASNPKVDPESVV